MRTTVDFRFTKHEVGKFDASCAVAMRNIFRGTKKATIAACEEILKMSLLEVPRDTSTLADSAFYEVSVREDIKSHVFEAIVGYGGNGDPINPKTGKPASSYMVAVHERLDVHHPVGKAKFLEDPVRRFANENFHRVVFTHARDSLAMFSR